MEFPCKSDTGVDLPIHPEGIAFDLDGTLLDYDGHLSDSVARAVQLIARSGIKVFLVTGRTQIACERYWQELGLDTPVATCNGAHVGFFGEEPFHHIRLSEKARDIIMKVETENNLYVNYYFDDRVLSVTDGPDRDFYSHQFVTVQLANSREEIRAMGPPTKCLCITSEEEQPRIMQLFSQALGDEALVTRSNTRFIELLPPGADKAVGLSALSRWSGIPLERFIAVGDAMNDVPMLQAAGFAIGFKSGDPRLGDFVDMLLPPLWEDGMEVLAKCVLGMTKSGRFFTPRSNRFFKK